MDSIKNNRLMSQCRSAANRFDKSEAKRKESQAALDDGRWKDMDEMGRIVQRASLRGVDSQFIAEALGGFDERIFERILGDSDLQPSRFLVEGGLACRTVGRIVAQSPRSLATGFMVSPELMLTNNHVLFSSESAQGAIIQFDYQEVKPGQIDQVQAFALRPDRLFLTDVKLDFTLVAVESVNDDGVDVQSRGWNHLIKQSGKAITNDRVNIIQHPNGRPQEISVRANKVLGPPVDSFLHYGADTQPGSSGSPVYNDEWQVAALHHAGIPILDDSGNIIDWRANEGVRISSIMSFIDKVAIRL
ncbi:MAG: trypsin-like peptidase domain-containing protein, partial [Arenicella sp.]|nr:trypsin-like peptidase domain-containing protein [Arenicella sp.]